MVFPFVLFAMSPGRQVDLKSLIPEMADLSRLTRPLSNLYEVAQSSSYDRASKSPNTADWFANKDWGNYVREIDQSGRKEFVMADLKGPGAVTRIWSANPSGTVRFYFDGETTPRLTAPFGSLLTGGFKPLAYPFSYEASKGTDLYFPFPYSKSLVITVDDQNGGRPQDIYYHVDYRTYQPDTKVQTFALAQLSDSKVQKELEEANEALSVDKPDIDEDWHDLPVPSGDSMSIVDNGPGTITEFDVQVPGLNRSSAAGVKWDDDHTDVQALRKLQLKIDFDGQTCVLCPLGDFFGSAPGINSFRTLPAEVTPDGIMRFRLPMPFHKSVVVSIQNKSSVLQDVQIRYAMDHHAPEADSYALHAQWSAEWTSTRPMTDMTFLNTTSEGNYVGTALTVANPVPDWWGEGDEKVWVDSPSFPQIFGTGSEDYFGYAWSNTSLFSRPFHAMSLCQGPGNFGYTSQVRWHLFDDIPYSHSILFSMEKWHWKECVCGYDKTAYWYAPATAPGPAPYQSSELQVPVLNSGAAPK